MKQLVCLVLILGLITPYPVMAAPKPTPLDKAITAAKKADATAVKAETAAVTAQKASDKAAANALAKQAAADAAAAKAAANPTTKNKNAAVKAAAVAVSAAKTAATAATNAAKKAVAAQKARATADAKVQTVGDLAVQSGKMLPIDKFGYDPVTGTLSPTYDASSLIK